MKLVLSLILSFSALAFDHGHKAFDEILQKRVIFKGNQSSVDYKGIKEEDSKKLSIYLKSLSSVSKKEYRSFSKDERLAFLINAYNAFTIDKIVKNYPVKSIKDLSTSVFGVPVPGKSVWDEKFFKFLGKKRSLNDIEHGMIRKSFKEPRIHFAVNCASIGCPSLANNAFVASSLDAQLEKAALNFLNNKMKNKVKGKTIYHSKIFTWYGGDFEVIGGFKKYIKTKLGLSGKFDFEDLDYDWNLNKL